MNLDLDALFLAVSLEWCEALRRDETALSNLTTWLEVDREALRRALDRRITAEPDGRKRQALRLELQGLTDRLAARRATSDQVTR